MRVRVKTQLVPRLPRKSSGAQGTPEGLQGVHPTPWQWILPQACHAKAAEPKERQRDARAYIRPLGSGDCPTPARQKRRSPKNARGTPGRASDPLAAEIVPRLPRKSCGAQGTPEGRQGVHPTPWQWKLSHACHAKAVEPKERRRTSDPLAAEIVPCLPRKSGGAQGTPALGSGDCPTPATQKQRSPRNARGTPGCTSDPLAVGDCPTPATQKRRSMTEPKERQRDARAYNRLLGSGDCPTPATQKRRAYIRPLGSGDCPTPATQKPLSPRNAREGVHPTPWQWRLSHACGAQGTPEGRQGVPLVSYW